jgi:hypothetical protein
LDLGLLNDLCADLGGMVEEQAVELRAGHLVGLRLRRFDGVREIYVPLDGAVGAGKARSPFLDEARRCHRGLDAERVEQLVAPRQLRLADVEARKRVALQHQDAASASCKSCRG